jgi:4-hydroxyphenylpyruvate dioxygenase
VAKLVEVTINDPDRAPGDANDQERMLPGQGRIDLNTFLKYLSDGGYGGPLSLEILRKEPPGQPAEVVAKEAYSALTRLIQNIHG